MKWLDKTLDIIWKILGMVPDKTSRPRVNRYRIEKDRQARNEALKDKHKPDPN